MIFNKYTFFILVIFLSLKSFSQNNELFNDKVDFCIKKLKSGRLNEESEQVLLKYADNSFLISDTIKIKVLYCLAVINNRLEKHEICTNYLTKAISLSKKNNSFYILPILKLKASLLNNLEIYDEAIKVYKEILSREKNEKERLFLYSDLIVALIHTKETESALFYEKRANETYNKIKIKDLPCESVYLLGVQFNIQFYVKKNYDSSLVLLKNGIVDEILPNSSYLNMQIANSYIQLEEYHSALNYVQEAKQIALKHCDTNYIIEAINFNIDIYKTLENKEMLSKAISEKEKYNGFSKLVKPKTIFNFFEESKALKIQAKSTPKTIIYLLILFFSVLLLILIRAYYRSIKTKNPVEKEDDLLKYLTPALKQKIAHTLIKIETEKEYLDSNFSMNYLQTRMNVNRKYISLYFKEIKQENFVDYTNKLRIQHLEEELKKEISAFHYKTIEEVFTLLGYRSLGTFKKHLINYSQLDIESLKLFISKNR